MPVKPLISLYLYIYISLAVLTPELDGQFCLLLERSTKLFVIPHKL